MKPAGSKVNPTSGDGTENAAAGRLPAADEVETILAACTSADDWNARKAADWWKIFEPSRAALAALG
jgi:hypothetical protein